MARHHMTPEGPVPFTPEEEAEWDAREAVWASNALNQQWQLVREERNGLLFGSDWTQLADAPLTAEQKEQWAILRQKWRDITNQDDPFNIVWPDVVIG